MRTISTLVDFTDTSKIAIKYACAIADKAGAKVQLFHVVEPDDTKEEKDHRRPDVEAVKKKLREFSDLEDLCNTEHEIIVESGRFANLIPALLKQHKSDLVLIATHGVKGIFQTIRGADVLKLIQNLGIPSLVMQNHTSPGFMTFRRILFPIASHENFEVKVKQTLDLAKLYNSKILVYFLYPENGKMDDVLQGNLDKTTDYFSKNGAEFEVVKESSRVYGIGYAKQALEFAKENDIELFSIMAHAAEEHSYFGNVERTDFILNKGGIPVLCCSE